METELQQFNQERSERVRILRDKHDRVLEQFDVESANMGFRYFSNQFVKFSFLIYLFI